MLWNNLSLNKKIILFIIVLLLVITAMAAMFTFRLNKIYTGITIVQQSENLVNIIQLRELDHLKWINTLQRFVYDENDNKLTVQTDPHKCGLGTWYYGDGAKNAIQFLPALKDHLSALEAPHKGLHDTASVIQNLMSEGKDAEAREYFDKVSLARMKEIQAELEKISTLANNNKETELAAFDENIHLAFIGTYATVGIGLIVSLILGLTLAKTVTAPTIALAKFASRIADGDFDAKIDINRKDELGSLAESLRRMIINIVNMIKKADQKAIEAKEECDKSQLYLKDTEEARIAAEARRTSMHEAAVKLENIVRLANEKAGYLSQSMIMATNGAENQKQCASDTATAMAEMSSAVTDVAQNAADAFQSADQAKENAADGAKIVSKTIDAIYKVSDKAKNIADAMNSLGDQAERINNVMNVISDIADQTNLLALNAAIEAARAGEAGRGFAVVADEVRKLAEKTMIATKEVDEVTRAIHQGTTENIKAVEAAGQAVEESTNLAQTAGESLNHIVKIYDITAKKVQAIAIASEEQSVASEQIIKSTEEVTRIAQENTELLAEAESGVHAIEELTSQISNVVAELKNI